VGLNRNHYFLFGVVLLLMGFQFRLLDSVVLNEPSTRFLAQTMGSKRDATTAQVLYTAGLEAAIPRQRLQSPRWCGWAFLSLGTVLVLHSIMLPKPA
jgi:hypothetical protein